MATPRTVAARRSMTRGALALACLGLVAALLAGCTVPAPPGAAPLRYRDAVFTDVGVAKDLVYGSAPDASGTPVDLKLDLYRPTGDTVAQRPAVVWVHGGGFSKGDKASGANFATYFAQRGYVVVSINYRLLAPPSCGGELDPAPECEAAAIEAQHDAQAAVRWLRVNASTYGVDPNRIAVGGGSAGAVTSLLVGWRSDDPARAATRAPRSGSRRPSRSRVGRPPTRRSTQATRRRSSSTGPPTPSWPTSGRSPTRPPCTTAASSRCSSRSRASATA